MDKAQKFAEKHRLSIKMALKVIGECEFVEEWENKKRPKIKPGNQKKIDRIRETETQITRISFKVGNETISIDDPAIIEYLRQCLKKTDILYTPTPKASRPKLTYNRILKVLALELMEGSFFPLQDEWNGCPNDWTKDQKYHFVGDIFADCMQSWNKKTSTKRRQDIINLLK
jgi:hypothetical protein